MASRERRLQASGLEWHQPSAQVGLGLVSESLFAPHRDYLAAGGSGFLLGDGAMDYGPEQIVEVYYRLQRIWPEDPGPVRWLSRAGAWTEAARPVPYRCSPWPQSLVPAGTSPSPSSTITASAA